MEEKLQLSQQQEGREANSLPALVEDSMSIGDRAKYIIASTATTGLGAAVLGFGEYSFLIAAAGGVVGFAFSDNMRNFIIDHAPAPKSARSRKSKLDWWITGRVTGDTRNKTNARAEELRAMPYADYLQTPEWDERRKRIRERDGNRCQDCGSSSQLDVHHLTYERRGNELDEDLVTLCHACHSKRHGIVGEPGQMEALQPRSARPQSTLKTTMREQNVRAFFSFSDVLAKGFRPSLGKIYLATLEDGTDVFVTAAQLCHVALAGATRGGKGHIKRSLMCQLAYAGAEIYLLDPNYTRWDRESRDPNGNPCPEDWTPFDPFLQNDPRELIPVKQKYRVIGDFLDAADQELDERLELYGNSRPVGDPIFLFLDELPDIVDNIPKAQSILKKLLRQGAKVGVNVACLSQDFLVETLFPKSGGGAVRECYRTVLYVGGDATTAKTLLDMVAKDVPENELGKGRAMVRCDVVRPAAKARVPYVDNQALYTLLGPSTYVEQDDEDERKVGAQLKPASRYESQDEPDTEKLPTTVRKVAGSSFDAYQARKTKHRVAASAPRVQGTPARAQVAQRGQSDEIEISTQDDELERGIKVYRAGARTLDAFQAAMGYPKQHQARQIWARVKIAIQGTNQRS